MSSYAVGGQVFPNFSEEITPDPLVQSILRVLPVIDLWRWAAAAGPERKIIYLTQKTTEKRLAQGELVGGGC